jgi:predicted protein tyrosine phosphatase
MNEIKIYPQFEFYNTTLFNDSNVEQFKHDFFICLNSSGNVHSIPHFKFNHYNVLNTYFDDTDVNRIKVSGQTVYYAIACTKEQARIIKQFIDLIPENSTIHIYCAKGESRSPAVAKFIKEYNGLISENYTTYNRHVYNLLRSI